MLIWGGGAAMSKTEKSQISQEEHPVYRKTYQGLISTPFWAHRRLVLKEYMRIGLNSGQPRILQYISKHQGCLHKDVAKNCGLDPSTITNSVNQLVKKGLLRREIFDSNRRETHLYVTETGHEIVQQCNKMMEEFDKQCMAGFTEEEKYWFEHCMKKLYKNMSGDELSDDVLELIT